MKRERKEAMENEQETWRMIAAVELLIQRTHEAGEKHQEAEAWIALGAAYGRLSHWMDALPPFEHAALLLRDLHETERLASALACTGTALAFLRRHQQALA